MKSKEYKYSKCFFFKYQVFLQKLFTTPKGEKVGVLTAFSFGP